MALSLFFRRAAFKGCPLQCRNVVSALRFQHILLPQRPVLLGSFISEQSKAREFLVPKCLSVVPGTMSFSVTAVNRSEHGDHSKLWTAERALSVSLLGIIPLAFLFPSKAMDYLLALSLVIHNHWGIEAVVVDYVRPSIFGNVIPKVAIFSLYLLSAAVLAGLALFINNDMGIINCIQQLWKL